MLSGCALFLVAGGCAPDAMGGAPRVLAEGGAWTWFNDERALIDGARLWVGFVDTAGYSSVLVRPLTGPGVPARHRLGSFRERDDHNNPALVSLGGGAVLVAYAAHHTEPYWYWRFGEPAGDSVVWSPEQRTLDLGANITYANLFRLTAEDGRIYNFFRGTNFNPTFMTSDDGGRTWSAPRHFMRAGEGRTRPYAKYASDGAGRIDVLYTQAHPRQGETDVYHLYYRDGWLHRSDGTRIQRLPGGGVAPISPEAGTPVYGAATAGRAWVWDLEYGPSGEPAAVYVAARDSTVGNDLRYRYARWDADAGQWREQEIARAGTHLYDGENHYAGGIALDPADPGVVYASSDVHPVTGEATGHYRLYRGITENGGATWSWIVLTPDAAEDNIRPFVPRGAGEGSPVLWLRGRYTTYTDFATDIVGLLEGSR